MPRRACRAPCGARSARPGGGAEGLVGVGRVHHDTPQRRRIPPDKLPAEVVQRDLLQHAPVAVAGIVDEHVDEALFSLHRGHQRRDGGGVGSPIRRPMDRPGASVSKACRAVSSRSVPTTRCPRARATSATARPRPLDTPVIRTVFMRCFMPRSTACPEATANDRCHHRCRTA